MGVMTKAGQVEMQLRKAIQAGRWASGEALPTERELTKKFSVSPTTLRAALGVLANEGLLIRRQGSGTFVADSPGKTGVIAALTTMGHVSDPVAFWSRDLLAELEKRVVSSGKRFLLCTGRESANADDFISSITIFDKPQVRDVMGVISLINVEPYQDRLMQAGIPSVSVDTVPTGHYCVVLNIERSMQVVAETMTEHGYDDFAIMSLDNSLEMNRLTAHRDQTIERLQKEAVRYRADRIVCVPYSRYYSRAYTAFKEWWARPDHPRAMYFADDALFDVASRAIIELGIKVPDELAIMSCANTGRRFPFPIPLTKVGFDASRTIDAAWDMLSRLIQGQSIDDPIVYAEPILVGGDSL